MVLFEDKIKELQERMDEPRKLIQVLAGPRQVGKTTLIHQFVDQCKQPITNLTSEMAGDKDARWLSEQWEKIRAFMRVSGEKEHILIVDEVQKLDNWSEVVKKEWDADTWNKVNIKVILLGSSRLLIKDGLTESLMGRFELIEMPHWSYTLMHKAFGMSVEQYVYYGGYPGTGDFLTDDRRWLKYVLNAIIDPAIDSDVLMTKVLYKPALMRQVFDLGCSYSSELLSYKKIVGQLDDAGSSATVASYLQTLGEAHLLAGLQKYAGDTARRYQSVPKLQVFNNALLTAYQGHGFDKERMEPARWGRWVESCVGAHLMNNQSLDGYKTYYWRDHDDEVDFVLVFRDRRVMALEVKSGRRRTNNGLRRFRDLFKPDKAFVIGKDDFPLELFLTISPKQLLDA